MDSLTNFDSLKDSLQEILNAIRLGKTQLPDFQRGWVWDDNHVRSLLASVSQSYPIGAVMLLETGNPKVRFKPRLVEGVSLPHSPVPEQLILDGQQRLTSLYQALRSGQPTATKDSRGTPIMRWYYLDIKKILSANGDREDAVVAVPEDRLVRNFQGKVQADYSTTEKECAAELFPLPLVFDTAGLTDWQLKYIQADPQRIPERLQRWNELVQNVIQRFQQYQVPLIILRKQTPKEAVCQVFEKVNTGGVSLTVFELLTATFAADDYDLRADWAARQHRLRQFSVLRSVESTDLLQVISLLTTYARKQQAPDAAISCKRKDILELSLADYQTWAEPATLGFEQAAKFLHMQKFYESRDLPYRTQLVPLAAALITLGDRAESDGIRARLAKWYWCGVFGELYGGAIETRFARDLPELVAWVDGGPDPATIQDANFAANRLYTLRTRNSAAYKGLSALLLRDGAQDFRTGAPIDVQMYFDERIDIHHIFPKNYCIKQGFETREWDCIVNKTPLSAKTNRYVVRGDAPSVYLSRLQEREEINTTRMNEILRSHVIDPVALRADDFHTFFNRRREELLDRIEAAMGKSVTHDIGPIGPAELEDDDDNDNTESEL